MAPDRPTRVHYMPVMLPSSAQSEKLSLPNYPRTPAMRSAYRLTAFQWRVYDLLHSQIIPAGRVTSYESLARRLSSSPRAVGGALRRNPFAPVVPCHRVVKASGQLGGYMGQSSSRSSSSQGDQKRLQKKIELLAEEGVLFDGKGMLRDPSQLI
ncbi:hypothetical protein E5Q_06187 [Mixia osmundae IAM 14324]|uniref:Methylated-DNA--protein-cysteine methyltransferase n=2 Tax=Mixia osmundae (strain CBS 9802 / IAM 14324 / JCM 22182 / KY 12970) TaxID=764103 RepID=G7E8L9_MIXOS|nr:hypothetical protein E5Q_06187 [Mixia osmundae IAM 14324]